MTSLTIRQAQMAALSEAFQLSWLRKEIESLYPAECEAMGPGGVARFVSEGLRRAKGLGFTSRDYLSYLALELCFGEKFLDDAKQAWLSKAMDGEAATRMERLRRAAIFRLAGMAEQEQRQEAALLDALNSDEQTLESVQ